MKLPAISAFVFGGSERFRRNLLRIALGSGGAQAIGLFALPFLSRLFPAESFGLLAYFMSTHAILVSIATMRFEWMMPNARTRMRMAALAVCGLGASVCFVALMALFAWLAAAPLAGVLERFGTSVPLAIAMVGASVLFGAVRNILYGWLVSADDLTSFAYGVFAQAVLNVVFCIGTALVVDADVETGGMILITGFILGQLAVSVVILAREWPRLRPIFAVRLRHALRVLRRSLALALQSTVVSFCNAVSAYMQFFLIGAIYGDKAVSLYLLAYRIAFAPIGFMTSAIVSSFWAEAASLRERDLRALRAFYLASLRRLALFGAGFCVLLFGLHFFVDIGLGEQEWRGTGLIMLAILPMIFANIMIGPTTHLVVYDKQIYQLYTDLAAVLGAALALYGAHAAGAGAVTGIFLASVMVALGYAARGLLHLKANTLAARG